MKLILELVDGRYMGEMDRGEAGIAQVYDVINPKTKEVIAKFTTHVGGGACISGKDAWGETGRIDFKSGDYKVDIFPFRKAKSLANK